MSKSSTFCLHPFTGMATSEDGALKPCCRAHPVGFIQDDTLENIWNNDNMKRIRKQMLNGERPKECIPCHVLEDQGVESLRQRHLKGEIPEARINLYPNWELKMNDDYSMPFELPTMELKMNNLCNLKCRMCSPMDSTSWNDWDTVSEYYKRENNFVVKTIEKFNLLNKPYLDKFEDNPNWWDSFEKLLPYFRRVEFAGGEPLMDPQHYKILDMLSRYGHQIEIKYATNLSMLGKGKRTVFEYWPKFRSVAVNVSIDGLGEAYEYIRGNANWDELISNIKQIQSIPNINRIVGATAIQANNVLILDKMIEYFLNDIGILFWSNFVRYPNVLSCQVLPVELKQVVTERLLNVKERVHGFDYIVKNPKYLTPTLNHIDNIISFVHGEDHSHLFQDFLDFNKKLDTSRNQGPIDNIFPDFKPYV